MESQLCMGVCQLFLLLFIFQIIIADFHVQWKPVKVNTSGRENVLTLSEVDLIHIQSKIFLSLILLDNTSEYTNMYIQNNNKQ